MKATYLNGSFFGEALFINVLVVVVVVVVLVVDVEPFFVLLL